MLYDKPSNQQDKNVKRQLKTYYWKGMPIKIPVANVMSTKYLNINIRVFK